MTSDDIYNRSPHLVGPSRSRAHDTPVTAENRPMRTTSRARRLRSCSCSSCLLLPWGLVAAQGNVEVHDFEAPATETAGRDDPLHTTSTSYSCLFLPEPALLCCLRACAASNLFIFYSLFTRKQVRIRIYLWRNCFQLCTSPSPNQYGDTASCFNLIAFSVDF